MLLFTLNITRSKGPPGLTDVSCFRGFVADKVIATAPFYFPPSQSGKRANTLLLITLNKPCARNTSLSKTVRWGGRPTTYSNAICPSLTTTHKQENKAVMQAITTVFQSHIREKEERRQT